MGIRNGDGGRILRWSLRFSVSVSVSSLLPSTISTSAFFKEKVLIYARAGRKLAKAAGNVVPAEPAEGDEKNWVIEGPLTDIRASYTSLGEGAYLVPNLGAWEGRYVCEVWADSEKFKTSPKFAVLQRGTSKL
ncbi:hypothetical protein LENED_009761 [Lentinula edodes]|uniref:Uncharacterized protein n=1 Tax=Lentinula edodes TaxID=5353 RepID=A0A1Q3EKL9_LENED|nr:hypothetical protein LENED_009761 [Lentinula edodes]